MYAERFVNMQLLERERFYAYGEPDTFILGRIILDTYAYVGGLRLLYAYK